MKLRAVLAPCFAAAVLLAQSPVPDVLRAQYEWGYAGADGEGQGTLSILLEPSAGRLVLEIHGLGERLVFLQGSRAEGYRVQIPRRNVDRTAQEIGGLPLPFLPAIGTPEALAKLLREGAAPGVKVSRRDERGPVKLAYEGRDEGGRRVQVWLKRVRWEDGKALSAPS